MPKTVVVMGATGHFGGRLCRRLLGAADCELIVTSRSASSGERLAKELRLQNPTAQVAAAVLDQPAARFEAQLAALQPDIVIHTAGPYQGQDYRVAKACIACGSHYLDLADGREFVHGFASLHDAASRRGVLLVAGASTLPGVSSAVIDHLRDRLERITAVEISIAPAHQTPRGAGTVAAVLSYCGKPFEVLVNGNPVTVHGWQNMRVQRYATLGTRLSAACDVPDLSLIPEYLNSVRTVTFHAALEAKWEHVGLWLMAGLTRLRLVSDWSRCVPWFQWLGNKLIKLGSDTGGMRVRLSGVGKDGADKSVVWDLIARQNQGPEIPCVPAVILARKLLADKISQRGAFPCQGLITLSEFDEEASDLNIDWQVKESPSG